jgi:cell division protein FtsL
MATRHQIKERTSEKIRRESAPIPWQLGLFGLCCMTILAFGFFFAAKQHFSSIELGMKNSDLRKAKDKLDADQRKLKAERDSVASEAAIEKAGLKIGLRKFTAGDFQFIDSTTTVPGDNSKMVADNKSRSAGKIEVAKVIKTVSVRPAEAEKKDPATRNGKTDAPRSMAKDTGRTLIAKK